MLRNCRALAAALTWGILLAAAGTADAQDLKIGFIRSATILDQYQGARVATETFNRDVDAWNQEMQRRKGELDLLGKALEAQSPMLSDVTRREKEQDYQRKLNEYDQYVQSLWGPGGLVQQRNEELLRPIVEKIQRIARKVAEEESYDFLFDASEGNLIYGDREYDLTARVVELLNQPE